MHDTVNRPVRSRFHNLGDGVIEPGGDGVNLRGVEGRMLLARGHGRALTRDDSRRGREETWAYTMNFSSFEWRSVARLGPA